VTYAQFSQRSTSQLSAFTHERSESMHLFYARFAHHGLASEAALQGLSGTIPTGHRPFQQSSLTEKERLHLPSKRRRPCLVRLVSPNHQTNSFRPASARRRREI
jgi:hypothetical protein